jgi:hypothetical protein
MERTVFLPSELAHIAATAGLQIHLAEEHILKPDVGILREPRFDLLGKPIAMAFARTS